MKTVVLNLKKDIICLAGNEFGYKVYLEQIRDQIDEDGKIEIVFPNQIQIVAISFVQGMLREIAKKVGKVNLKKYVTIKTSSDDLTNDIYNNMEY